MTILWYSGCYMGFDVYELISEHKKPGKTVGYFAYLPKTGSGKRKIGTHRRSKLEDVKKEIRQIFKEHNLKNSVTKSVQSSKLVRRFMGFDIYEITIKNKKQYVAFIPTIGTDNYRIGTHVKNTLGEITQEINIIIRQHDLCRNIIKVVEHVKRRNLIHTPDKLTVKCKAPKSPFEKTRRRLKLKNKKPKKIVKKRKR